MSLGKITLMTPLRKLDAKKRIFSYINLDSINQPTSTYNITLC